MVKCEYCGKEIGLLAIRYSWLDKENKIAIHDKCIKEYEKKKLKVSLEPQEELEKQPLEEEIIGKINGLNLPGLADNYYNLLFTNRRVVGEKVGGNAAAFLVGGLIGAAVSNAYSKKKSQDMVSENPDDILSKHKKNFEIDYANIDEVLLKKKKVRITLNQSQAIIGRKPTFYFKKNQQDEISSILTKTLSNKINMKERVLFIDKDGFDNRLVKENN